MDIRNFIEKWTNEQLCDFLRKQNLQVLHLVKSDYLILAEKRITGCSFLYITKEDLRLAGLELGPAIEIYNLKEKITTGI